MSGGNQSALHQSLVSAVRDYIHARGGWCIKYFAGGLGGLAGAPDFFVALRIPGVGMAAFIAIECKTGSAVLGPAQERVKADLERVGVIYVVAHSVDDVEAALLTAGLVLSPALLGFSRKG